MLSFYSDKGRLMARYRKQKNGNKISLVYFPGLSSEGFSSDTQRFKNQKEQKQLSEIQKAIFDVIEKNDPFTLNSDLFTKLVNESRTGVVEIKNPFFTYCETYFKKTLERHKKRSVRSIENTIGELREFNPNLSFEDIDRKFYRDFLNHLHDKNKSKNYTGLHIKNLKTILYDAADAGENKNTVFRDFKKPQENVYNIYLDEHEIKAIYNLEITELMALEIQKESNKNMSYANIYNMVKALDKARKLFIIGCCTGLRAENYLSIDPDIQIDIDGGYIHAIANKGGQKLQIPLHKMIKEIVESGGFPKSISQQKLNKHIKILGQLASQSAPSLKEVIRYTKTVGNEIKVFEQPKYKLIKTHTARRSFCSNLYKKGVPIQYIMAVSGHKSEAMFRKYIAQVKKDEITTKLKDFDVWGY